ncbi:ABC-type nitrate/sulfonate/bicarbonate transport systems periplasmic components-like protein [Acidothermus cellulolyticus 11B]|uniref:ABC-type nitrate/sulfonate/bicarbonate transport systems periplasmic components-like protein n=1 Tax=Acidothermus cellulolyticus (strain ATCC 43068 / DSM 8971 / 11B) TaxID=351607 RepID=A0LTA2_ACIC1|nr:ABC-type nitrate/sulfonate/bicarbonate transport systems periplasmic components-like protein [Acidothermus cellulolyticus 11B]
MTTRALNQRLAWASLLTAGMLALAACSSSKPASTSAASSTAAPSSAASSSASSPASSASGSAGASAPTAPHGTAPVSPPPAGPLPKLTIGSPGVPPVVSGLLPYIADKKGFYKAFGVDVTVKSFTTGTDATRAMSTGQIDIAIAPPAQVVALVAKGIPIVAIQGQENPDWVVVSTDPAINSCQKLKGQGVGVDAIGGIRYTALAVMLKTCGLTIKDVHPLAFPGDANPQAVIAGQLKVSVLHLNEVVAVQQQLGKPLTTVMVQAQVVPNSMYEMFATLKSKLDQNRDAFVRFVAAQIATLNWMFDPANADEVAQLATVVGDSAQVMKQAMAEYKQMDFWSLDSAGLPQTNVENVIKSQVAAGNVPADKAPTYSQIVDLSVYQDAQKLVQP